MLYDEKETMKGQKSLPLGPYSRGISLLALILQLSCSHGAADVGLEVKDSGRPTSNATVPGSGSYTIAGITLEAPVYITRVEIFKDGGTIEVKFTDVNGSSLRAYLDGRFVEDDSHVESDRKKNEARYFSVGEPITSPEARRLDIGGADEQELYRLLKSCIDQASETRQPLVRHGAEYGGFSPNPDLEREWLTAFKSALEWHLRIPAPAK